MNRKRQKVERAKHWAKPRTGSVRRKVGFGGEAEEELGRKRGLTENMKGCELEARGWGSGERILKCWRGNLEATEWKRSEGNGRCGGRS